MNFRQLFFLYLTAVALILAACSPSANATANRTANLDPPLAQSNKAACPITHPPEARFVPPQPWPEYPPAADQFWYGDSTLWTALPASGSWRQLALGEKFWWWSQDFDVAKDATPDLVVKARRLDGAADTFQVTEATNGYHNSFHWAMLVGVTLPSPGCWEVTGIYNDQTLSFVLWVPSA